MTKDTNDFQDSEERHPAEMFGSCIEVSSPSSLSSLSPKILRNTLVEFPSTLLKCPKHLKSSAYHRILGLIFESCRQKNFHTNPFVQINHLEFKAICLDYKKYIEFLKGTGDLEVAEGYCHGTANAFCKAYRFADRHIFPSTKAGKDKELKKSQKVIRTWFYPHDIEGYRVPEQQDSESTALVRKQLSERVSVDSSYIEGVMTDWDFRWLRKTDLHFISSNQGKTKRIYHNATFLSSNIRERYLLIDGERIFKADFSALQPHLLLAMCAHPDEQDDFRSLFEGGFYKNFGRITKQRSKDYCKKAFQIFLSGKFRRKGKSAALLFFQYLQKRFPYLTQRVQRYWDSTISLQCLFQEKEAVLVIEKLLQVLHKHNIPVIPVHDCLYCKESDLGTVSQLMERSAQVEFGLRVPVRCERLEDPHYPLLTDHSEETVQQLLSEVFPERYEVSQNLLEVFNAPEAVETPTATHGDLIFGLLGVSREEARRKFGDSASSTEQLEEEEELQWLR